MKKIILSSLLVTVLFTGSCLFTDKSEIIVDDITASGTYDAQANLSTLNIRFRIRNTNLITGEITNWRIFLFAREDGDTAYLSYSQDNYRWYLCEDVDCNNLTLESTPTFVILSVDKTGDLYQGKTPYLIDVDVVVRDENDYQYAISETADFDFTRYPD